MSCDICGQDKRTMLTDIENAKIYVCQDCNPSGQGVVKKTPTYNNTRPKVQNNNFRPSQNYQKKKMPSNFKYGQRKPKLFDSQDYEFVDNYGEVIRKAREQKGLTLTELANNLKEQESYIHKIEQGKLKPNDAVIFKLFNFLGVNLIKSNQNDDSLEQVSSESLKEEIKHVEPFTTIVANKKRKLVY